MATNNNLKEFFTDVADAIREKEGSTGLINPQDFSAKIRAIETGGGGESGGGGGASAGAVNFRDYDGTILHSFSKDEFLALEALPELPTQAGLICQEWNWSLEDAQEYVAEYGVMEIGASYTTDDGNTRLYLNIVDSANMLVRLRFGQSANGVLVDWGDGSDAETFSGTTVNTTHQYNAIGNYVINLKVLSGTLNFTGTTSYNTFGSIGSSVSFVVHSMLNKIEFGKNITIGTYAFQYCGNLATIAMPKNIKSIGNNAFQYCSLLRSSSLPSAITTTGSSAFADCYSLKNVCVPNSYTFPNSIFYNCYSLEKIIIPEGSTFGTYAFSNCYALCDIIIPEGITFGDSTFVSTGIKRIVMPRGTIMGTYMFQTCRSLNTAILGEGTNNTASNAFKGCTGLVSVDLPNTLMKIDANIFSGCSSLKNVEIPSGVTDIGASAFADCGTLKTIKIPSGVTSIGSSAFSNCTTLRSINIPSGVTAINGSTFYNCKSLASLVIPSGVTSIGSSAFNGCYGLVYIDCRTLSVVPSLANTNALSNTSSSLKVIVPDDLYDSWIATTNWSSHSSKIVKASEYTD